jgi:hypothetical protein
MMKYAHVNENELVLAWYEQNQDRYNHIEELNLLDDSHVQEMTTWFEKTVPDPFDVSPIPPLEIASEDEPSKKTRRGNTGKATSA